MTCMRGLMQGIISAKSISSNCKKCFLRGFKYKVTFSASSKALNQKMQNIEKICSSSLEEFQ